eukprot:11188073-Lingulodinium_polyedra.AAC.1
MLQLQLKTASDLQTWLKSLAQTAACCGIVVANTAAAAARLATASDSPNAADTVADPAQKP